MLFCLCCRFVDAVVSWVRVYGDCLLVLCGLVLWLSAVVGLLVCFGCGGICVCVLIVLVFVIRNLFIFVVYLVVC